ncbi:hypothetical protein K7X08_031881 [Anisodus acutangulus]|uniref:EF-hand domain-containing protein n=1 Tax=Anisodus acutangulus TaxID=402998 RepID=A0A9Q1MQX1_9SOLA|nr:hypothetical protein K7X08_031881 [Anisodus acutangulus]
MRMETISSTENKSVFSRLRNKFSSKKPIIINDTTSTSNNTLSLSIITPTSSENSDQLERVFTYFDEDGDGKVSPAELRRCVKVVGGDLTEEEAEMAVRLSDSDGDGMLGLEDFSKLMEGEKNKESELRGAFEMYEMEGSGQITPKSLKRMLSRLGESTSIDNCKAMIQRFDLDGDGVLSFDEFKIMMNDEIKQQDMDAASEPHFTPISETDAPGTRIKPVQTQRVFSNLLAGTAATDFICLGLGDKCNDY